MFHCTKVCKAAYSWGMLEFLIHNHLVTGRIIKISNMETTQLQLNPNTVSVFQIIVAEDGSWGLNLIHVVADGAVSMALTDYLVASM